MRGTHLTFSLAFYLTNLWLIAGCLLAVLLVAGEIGWRVGRHAAGGDESLRTLVGGLAAATIGFLGLLLGFALSMAISRFDARRAVIVDEANAIGTLWLRAGLLDEPIRSEIRGVLRDYTDARVDLGRIGTDLGKLRDARERSAKAERAVWALVERAVQPGINPGVVTTLVPAANEMIDLDELRMASLENVLPTPIILLLVAVASVALALLGWSFGASGQRSQTSMALLALVVTVVLGMIIDINRPHRGLIRVGDQSLVRLQRSLAAPESP